LNCYPISVEELTLLLRQKDVEKVAFLLKQTIEAKLFEVNNEGLIFSRRLLKERNLGDKRRDAGSKGGKKRQENILLKQENIANSGNGNGNGSSSENSSLKSKESEIPEWALEVQLAWNRWRLGNGLGSDPTGSVNGQGMKNLLKLAKKPEALPAESLARCAERYLMTVTNAEFVCHFANFWGRARRFEEFLANDWAPSTKTQAQIAHAEMLAARNASISMDDCDDDFN